MPETFLNNLSTLHLSGARIWLSGALPEEGTISDEQRESLKAFVRRFARLVFESGGILFTVVIRVSHPFCWKKQSAIKRMEVERML